MEDRKEIMIVIGCSIALFLGIICYCIFGLGSGKETNGNENKQQENQNEGNEETGLDPVIVNLTSTTVTYSIHSTKYLSNLYDILNNANFISSNTDDTEDEFGMYAKIREDDILVDLGETVFLLNDIKNAKAIKISLLSAADLYPIQLYVLTKDNTLYNVLINEDETCTINKYNISVENFSMNPHKLDNTEWWRNFVIIRTTDGRYITDYQFSETEDYESMETIVLTELH